MHRPRGVAVANKQVTNRFLEKVGRGARGDTFLASRRPRSGSCLSAASHRDLRAVTAHDRAIASLWTKADVVSRAPGRVNLIGEHTDYNEGFVLPMALPLDTVVVGAIESAADGVTIISEPFGSVRFHTDGTTAEPFDTMHWAAHIIGAHQLLFEAGVRVPPWSGAVATDVPIGANLSSSAALLVATVGAALRLAGDSWDPVRIVELCRCVENDVLGLPSGIMDHLISATAVAGAASLIDCRTYEAHRIPVPAATRVAVLDTKSRRELLDSEFANRRAACEVACEQLGVATLRDTTMADVALLADSTVRRRATHVVTENIRTLGAAEAALNDDPERFGELMTHSHMSLRDDFEVSGPELDAIVDAALTAPGCFGARMTGGGFAGCAVALVAVEASDEFIGAVTNSFERTTGVEPNVMLAAPGPGATVS